MTSVKICGITDPADAVMSCDLGAWAIGMIFVAESKRCISPSEGQAIVRAVEGRANTVAVFADAAPDVIASTVDTVGCSMIQLHGSETPSELEAIADSTGLPVIRALRMQDSLTVNEFSEFRADYFLADSYEVGILGGTGKVFDWSALGRTPPEPLLLSGGLSPRNVAQAVRSVSPFGVDVSSGVEKVVRHKDPAKLEAFFAAVKEAS